MLMSKFQSTAIPAATACASAATCILPETDPLWAGVVGKGATPLHLALEHGHATAAEAIMKGAVKAGADLSASPELGVDMLHRAASKWVFAYTISSSSLPTKLACYT